MPLTPKKKRELEEYLKKKNDQKYVPFERYSPPSSPMALIAIAVIVVVLVILVGVK